MNTKLDDAKLAEILKSGKYLSEENLKKASDFAAEFNTSFVDALYQLQLMTQDILGQAISEFYKVNYWDLNSKQPDKETVLKLNADFAQENNILIADESKDTITVVNDDPTVKDEVVKVFKELFPKKKIVYAFSLTEDIQNLFHYFQKSVKDSFVDIEKSETDPAPALVKVMIENAVNNRASDIHIEPQEETVIVRYRIDGILREVGQIKPEIYLNVLNRIKVLAKVRIDQYNAPQDGAIRYKLSNQEVDIRVSFAPILTGQKVVMRVLSKYLSALNMDELGISAELKAALDRAISKNFGMIITAGPTGSGKTTTLYALIKKIHSSKVNITTIEDPVEYRIKGINQIQVNNDLNITFARGLRTIVRQDPDVILVGEIRDTETAEISVNAALTGHLVLSTFHANDSATVVPRLLDMGIEPFLLSSTLNLIIGQRLVRKLCDSCRVSETVSATSFKKEFPQLTSYFTSKEIRMYKAKGCDKCGGTGFRGRTGIYEYIEVTGDIAQLVSEKPASKDLKQLALKKGFGSFLDDGIEKVKSGITTIEELLRVIPEDTSK